MGVEVGTWVAARVSVGTGVFVFVAGNVGVVIAVGEVQPVRTNKIINAKKILRSNWHLLSANLVVLPQL